VTRRLLIFDGCNIIAYGPLQVRRLGFGYDLVHCTRTVLNRKKCSIPTSWIEGTVATSELDQSLALWGVIDVDMHE